MYILIFMLGYFFTLLDIVNLEYRAKKFILITYLIIILTFTTFRLGVGADFYGYLSYYNQTILNFNQDFEFGYRVLIKISHFINPSFTFFLFLNAIFTFYFIYKSIENYNYLLFIPLYIYMCLYFIGGPFGQMRQALSISIILYSFKYISEENVFMFVIFVLFATSIHISSIVFLPAYFVVKWDLSKKQMLIVLLITIIISRFQLSKNLLQYLLSKIDSFQGSSLDLYLNESKHSSQYLGGPFAHIERIGIFLISLYFHEFDKNDDDKKYMVLYWCSLIIFYFFNDISIIAQRVSRVYKIFDIFLYANIYKHYSSKKDRLLILIAMSILLLKPFVIIKNTPSRYIPYKTIFSKK